MMKPALKKLETGLRNRMNQILTSIRKLLLGHTEELSLSQRVELMALLGSIFQKISTRVTPHSLPVVPPDVKEIDDLAALGKQIIQLGCQEYRDLFRIEHCLKSYWGTHPSESVVRDWLASVDKIKSEP